MHRWGLEITLLDGRQHNVMGVFYHFLITTTRFEYNKGPTLTLME